MDKEELIHNTRGKVIALNAKFKNGDARHHAVFFGAEVPVNYVKHYFQALSYVLHHGDFCWPLNKGLGKERDKALEALSTDLILKINNHTAAILRSDLEGSIAYYNEILDQDRSSTRFDEKERRQPVRSAAEFCKFYFELTSAYDPFGPAWGSSSYEVVTFGESKIVLKDIEI
jgi:hypothetical protein